MILALQLCRIMLVTISNSFRSIFKRTQSALSAPRDCSCNFFQRDCRKVNNDVNNIRITRWTYAGARLRKRKKEDDEDDIISKDNSSRKPPMLK